MTEVLLALGAVVALLLGALAATFVPMLRRRPELQLLQQHLRYKVIVTLKTGESFGGVLTDSDSQALVLANAEALGVGERGASVPVDGVVLVLRADVAFVQIP